MTEDELLARARGLAGRTLGEIAARAGRPPPWDPRRHKGATGWLLERVLGADAGSRAAPDFAALGVELKTLPIDARGRPAESTFVCCAPAEPEPRWEAALVRRKLARVLFVPVEASAPWEHRRVGAALLWSPDAEAEAMLRADWEELVARLVADAEHVSARCGRVLQLRPKARTGAVRARSIDAEGAPRWGAPRAFYLRRSFTEAILVASGLRRPAAPHGAAGGAS